MQDTITVTLEDGTKHTYTGRMAGHSLLYLAGQGFLDDLVDQAVSTQKKINVQETS